jgi:hypothetical protein
MLNIFLEDLIVLCSIDLDLLLFCLLPCRVVGVHFKTEGNYLFSTTLLMFFLRHTRPISRL